MQTYMTEVEIPLQTVVDATGFSVTVETIDGTVYTGKLLRMDVVHSDVELIDVRCQHRDSSLSVECRVFIQGSNIRLIHLPADVRKAAYLDWENPNVQKDLKNSFKSRRPKEPKRSKLRVSKAKKNKLDKLKKHI